MAVTVKAVDLVNKKEIERFLHLPWKIYITPDGKRDPNWVPPLLMDQRSLLDPKKNPFHEHAKVALFAAYNEKNEIVGRISASADDNFLKQWNEKTGHFGWFECVNDVAVAKALFQEAEKFLKSQGMTKVIGPASFTANDDYYGFLLKGYDQPGVMAMTYNPPYYLELAEKCGYAKAKDLYAWWLDATKPFPERIVRIAEHIKKKENLVIRSLNMKKFFQEVMAFKEVYNRAWYANWGAVAMTDAELNYQATKLKDIVVPEYIIFAEVDGKTVGACLCTPDINQVLKIMDGELFSFHDPFAIFKFLFGAGKILGIGQVINRARLMALGVVPEYRLKGIEAVLYYEIYKAGVSNGVAGGELSWTLEDNDMINKGIAATGATQYKSYRIYGKNL
jgi:GNAT superfamily N-acetyltransferase